MSTMKSLISHLRWQLEAAPPFSMTFSSLRPTVSIFRFFNGAPTSINLFNLLVMKQRMQLCKNLSVSQCYRDIIREEGLRGLYRSYPLTVGMNIPFASVVICCNENLKTVVRPWERQHSYFWYFLCAGTAGGIAGFVTNPLDVIKTRL